MGWGAVAAFATPIIGGMIAGDASQSAADTQSQAAIQAAQIQANATNQAADVQKQMFEENRSTLAPWVSQGTMAASDLSKFAGVTGNGVDMTAPGAQMFSPSNMFLDPSYSFIKKEQDDGLMNQRSAMGGVLSGNTLKELATYDTGLASTEYGNSFNRWNTMINNVFNRLSSISGSGENAAGMTANLGSASAANIGNSLIAGANATAAGQTGAAAAKAAGAVGSTNALTGGITQGVNNYLLAKILMQGGNNPFGGGPTQQLPTSAPGSFDFSQVQMA